MKLDVCTFDAVQGVDPIDLAPGEPPGQLVGVQALSQSGMASEERDGGKLRGRHFGRLERH
ncbi:hypothetical protein ACLM5J_07800 [Nocardioides sp. Bht2]|uniref:hypothetical protein n=1 Tax=Nocardioides sp. Bht2 TaxID=3392297 RepID=UPI0039B6D381